MTRLIWALLGGAILCFLGSKLSLAQEPVTFFLPHSYKSEGRITLTYSTNEGATEHQLAFEEIVDSSTKRSKLKIGHIAAPPNVYYLRDDKRLKIDELGRCKPVNQDKALGLVPELEWFVRMSYTHDEIETRFEQNSFLMGPSLLLNTTLSFGKDVEFQYVRVETHRNVDCRVAVANYKRKIVETARLEVFSPQADLIQDNLIPFFTVKEKAFNINNLEELKGLDASFTLDFYSIESFANMNSEELLGVEEEFSLPFGAGCSQFLTSLPPPDIKAESFVIAFNQYSEQSFKMLAYDDETGYLRRESYPSGIISIWDINEDLLYSINKQATLSTIIDSRQSIKLDSLTQLDQPRTSTETCSVLNVGDDSLGAAQRPHCKQESRKGKFFDVLQFLGATSLVYIGRATKRDLPCLVYETVADEPPAVFGLSVDAEERHKGRFDYIIQFYILKTTKIVENKNKIGNEFWPVEINLIKRHRESGMKLDNYDSLDVADFYWGLFGLDKKPSELFMAPDCFDVEEEQVKLELLFDFKKNGIKFGQNYMNEMRENKYLLELSLLNDLFKLFKISRLHLTEFQLTLRTHDAVASLVISDRKYDKALTYFGLGELPDNKDTSGDRITLNGAFDEQRCVLLGSHIADITMVAYCPYVAGVRQQPQCIAVVSELAPVIKRTKDNFEHQSNPFLENNPACHIYSFSAAAPPASGTRNWSKWRDLLHGHEFNFFTTTDSNQQATYTARVRHFNLDRKVPLSVIANYRYLATEELTSDQKSAPKVHSFPMMFYNSIGDCARMCNLDISCFSYSYCTTQTDNLNEANAQVPKDEKCLLSSLDIRESDVNQQLMFAKLSEENTVQVRSGKGYQEAEYTLKLTNGCKIHEKDYLDSFSETGERLSYDETNNYAPQRSLTECAKSALELEGMLNQEQSHMIAYCPETQTCLLDAKLFATINEKQAAKEEKSEENDDEQSNCLIYRRKYQTFFHASTKVLRQSRIGDTKQEAKELVDQFSQLPIELTTVEECARACWIEFGHVCASFDYCSSDSLCLINSIAFEDQTLDDKNVTDRRKATSEKLDRLLEQRAGCLHYERDLRIDQIRQSHASLRHKALDLSLVSGGLLYQQDKWTLARVLVYTLTFCTVSVCFLAGLVLGRRVNERLEGKSIVMPGSNGIANFINTFASSAKDDDDDTMKLGGGETQMMAIQLEEMGQRENGRD